MIDENTSNIEFLDILNILSFIIGIKNLNKNLSQSKAADLLSAAVDDIHKHLAEQDRKIELILDILGGNNNEKD